MDDTGVNPTELAGTAESEMQTELAGTAGAETDSIAAWSLEDEEPEGRRFFTAGRITATAIITSLVAIVGVAVFAGYTIGNRQTPVAAVKQAPGLNGTYRITYDNAKQTRSGTPAPVDRSTALSWAFRTTCESECVAVGVALDAPSDAARPSTTLRLVGDAWVEDPYAYTVQQPQCLLPGNVLGPGPERLQGRWLFRSSTLAGVETSTVLTLECGRQGTVYATPITLSRVGDIPAGVSMPDPQPAKRTSENGGPLNGIYAIGFDQAKQTVNGQDVAYPVPDFTEMWAFRSICTDNGCAVAAAQVNPGNVAQNTGITSVARLINGQWEFPAALQPALPCIGGTGAASSTIAWRLTNIPDGALTGLAVRTIITDECASKGYIYRTPISASRTGDIPSSVVLADPSAFIADR